MKRLIKNSLKITLENSRNWTITHQFQLLVFNIFLMVLVLLRSAGYFEPFFSLSVNFIFFISLVLAIFLLRMRSRASFFISVIFWMLAAIFRVVKIDVWAERAALYSYEALVVGMILFIIEIVTKKSTR